MKNRPEALEDADVIRALAAGWLIETTEMKYVPLGGGSYHWAVDDIDGRRWFVSATDLDDAPWLGLDRASAWQGLEATMHAATTLRSAVGHSFVVAPVRCRDESVVWRINPRYGLAIHRYLEGECGDFGAPMDGRGNEAVLDMITALHTTPVGTVGLGELIDVDTGEALDPTNPTIGPVIDRYHDLRRHCDGRQLVITHGEPHAGNVMRVGDETYLIDWDTAALALPERDLWLLVDHGNAEALAGYEERTGHTPDVAALAFYRLRWAIEDLVGALRDGDAAATQRALDKARAAADL